MSKIEWTEQTWNPIIGCSKISAGCENCYAEKMAGRLASISSTMDNYCNVIDIKQDKTGQLKLLSEWNGSTHFIKSALNKPIKRKKPTMYFVCSMGDLFHESVPFEWIDKIMAVIAQSPQHTFQILTKRPERMKEYFETDQSKWTSRQGAIQHLCDVHYARTCKKEDFGKTGRTRLWENYPMKNLWLGVTAENQEQANKRIPILLQIPAKVRFVSIEPMLGPIDFYDIIMGNELYNTLKGFGDISGSMGIFNGLKLDWVICGGETGPNARPMHPAWVRSIRDQCKSANTPFFFKKWGEWIETDLTAEQKVNEKYIVFGKDGKEYIMAGEKLFPVYMKKVGKNKAGHLIYGVEHRELPKGGNK